MGENVIKNYFYNLSYQIVTLLTPFITMPYVSRVLGADGIGIYSYTTSIVTYFALLATLGLADYGQREIAYHQNDRYAQSRILYEVSIFRCIAVAFSLCLYYILIVRNTETNLIVFEIQAINIIALLFDISWFFQGLEDFAKVALRNISIRLLSIVMLFAFVKQADDLWIYVLINASVVLLGGMLICCFLPKYLVKVPLNEIKPFRNCKAIMQLFAPQIAIQIYMVLDKTMIGLYSPVAAENGYYEQATKCIRMAQMIIGSLGIVFMSKIAFAYENKDFAQIKNSIMKCYRFVWAVGLPLVLFIVVISPYFIPWFLGEGFSKTAILMQWLSPLIIIIGFSGITGPQYLIPTRQENLLTMSVILGLVVNAGLNAILIPRFYSVGAVWASLIAESAVTIFQFYLVREMFNAKEVMLLIKSYLPAIGITATIMIALSRFLSISSVNTGIILGTGSLTYIGLLLLSKDEFALLIKDRINGLVSRMFSKGDN